MSTIIRCYDNPTEQQVGGKFAKQAKMLAAGLPVPKFFCLTKDLYEQQVANCRQQLTDILAAINFDDLRSIQGGAAQLQACIERTEIGAARQQAILAAFDAMFAAGDLVSVRASTVGYRLEDSEDSVSNPFAGMSESFLYVRRDQVVERIKSCWASGFSQESLIYRHAQNMDLLGFGVAVGIQQMIFGERSFVLFTADPKTSARDRIIIAGHGIGEGVVQEKVAVDHYFVNFKTNAISKTIAAKPTMLTFDAGQGCGLRESAVPDVLQEQPCLSDAQILLLVEMGQKVETLFGLPQDIEGTLTADGSVHLLQSRPIALDYGRQIVWTNTNVTESYPGVSTALTFTHAKYFYRVIFYDLYRRLGVSQNKIWDNYIPLDNMIGYLNGHVYYCLSHFYLLHKQSPLFPLFGAHWENMIGLTSSYQTHQETRFGDLLNKAKLWGGVAVAAVKTLADFLGHDRKMTNYHDWWEKRIAPLRGKSLEREDPLKLVNLFHEVWGEVGNQWGVTLTTDAYLIPLYGASEMLFRKWRLDQQNPGLLSDLLCGDEKLLSVEIILSAVNLAQQARANPALNEAFNNHDDKSLWHELECGRLDQAFSAAVRQHLHQYGDRGLQELKLEQPSLRDTPWVLLKMVRQYVQQTVTVQSFRDHEVAVRSRADAELAQLLANSPLKHRLLTKFILPRLRTLIRHRENSRYCRSELFGFSKMIFRGLGHYLVSRNVLRDWQDVFHLTQDEVFGYINGMGVTENLQALADLRRREHEQHLAIEVPEQITTYGAVREADLRAATPESDSGAALKGLGSSAGRVRGIARVVQDPNVFERCNEDMILIARETDPGWLFLMLASKGMVVERGSMLSHTAITGRKFGIPTIVALNNATRRIPDGALIEIDGAAGTVTILELPDIDVQDANLRKAAGEVR